MGALFGSNKTTDTKPNFTALQIQSSTTGLPIPLAWGTSKLAPNMVWYGDFTAVPHSETTGGKGGGSQTTKSFTYQASLVFALCEGFVSAVPLCWAGKTLVNPVVDLGYELIPGARQQATWSYLASAHPAQALGYSNTALMVISNYDLGGSSSLPNHNFKVQANLAGSLTGIVNSRDADVGMLIVDFLTNELYGANFPASFIDVGSLTGGSGSGSLGAFTKSLGIGLSPVLSTREQANAVLTRWMQLTFCEAVWNGSTLRFVPLLGTDLAGNGWTWKAPTAVLFSLNDNDYVREGTDPVICSRNDVADAYNVVRLEILDGANGYQPSIIEQREEAHIRQFGMRIMSTIQAHDITDAAMASKIASLTLQRGLSVRNMYTFKLSWEYCVLDPMDVVQITDADLGLVAWPVRIQSITENSDFTLTIEAEDFPQINGAAVAYPTQAMLPIVVTQNTAPAFVTAPLIFEPPPTLVGPAPQIWIAACGSVTGVADPYWGGCNVWVSQDNVTFSNIGTINGPARMGVLTAALPSYAGLAPDSADTFAVDMAMSGGAFISVSVADAASGQTACWVGGEALSFKTATLTAAKRYDCTSLYRGLGGTPVAAHASGVPFCRLDSLIFKHTIPQEYIGKPLYLKLQSFNVWGHAVQDMSTLTSFTYTPTGAGNSLASNPVFSTLLSGQKYDCGVTGTTVIASADCGLTGTASLGIINLGVTS